LALVHDGSKLFARNASESSQLALAQGAEQLPQGQRVGLAKMIAIHVRSPDVVAVFTLELGFEFVHRGAVVRARAVAELGFQSALQVFAVLGVLGVALLKPPAKRVL